MKMISWFPSLCFHIQLVPLRGDMDFLRPVDIGDLLRFRARVLLVHSAGAGDGGRPCVDVEVEALVGGWIRCWIPLFISRSLFCSRQTRFS
jgi:hypothetical protein